MRLKNMPKNSLLEEPQLPRNILFRQGTVHVHNSLPSLSQAASQSKQKNITIHISGLRRKIFSRQNNTDTFSWTMEVPSYMRLEDLGKAMMNEVSGEIWLKSL
jgi:hypothetical protein